MESMGKPRPYRLNTPPGHTRPSVTAPYSDGLVRDRRQVPGLARLAPYIFPTMLPGINTSASICYNGCVKQYIIQRITDIHS